MDVDLPRQAVRDHWEAVEADLESTAAELEAAGWTTVTLHTGDVTIVPDDDSSGRIDVLVPGNEFDALEAEIDAGATFTETAVFRQAAGGVAFLVCVFRDPEAEVAALLPAFYAQRGTSVLALAANARAAGTLSLDVHPLQRDRVVTFRIDDPALVFPTE